MEEVKRQRGRPKKQPVDSGNNSDSNQSTSTYDSQNSMDESEVDDNQSFDNNQDPDADLKSAIGQNNKSNKKPQTDFSNIDESAIDAAIEKKINQFEQKAGGNDIPDEETYSPLNEGINDKSYRNQQPNPNPTQERVIIEPIYQNTGQTKTPDVDDSLINPNSGQNNTNQKSNNSSSNSTTTPPVNDIPNDSPSGGGQTTFTETQPIEPEQSLKELTPKEKRESVEKTAETILLAYKQYVPIPFIYFSSFSNKKLEKSHEKNEIDIKTPMFRDGRNFKQYAKSFNEQVEEAFIVTDEEVNMLREPLVDVLMENNIAMTPQQRLMFTAGQLLVGKVMMCMKFLRDKKSDMADLKQYHKERMEKAGGGTDAYAQPPVTQTQNKNQGDATPYDATKNQAPTPQNTEAANIKVVSKEGKDVDEAEVLSETKDDKKVEFKTPSLEDVIGMGEEEENENQESKNDIPD